jgi:Carbohydrate family 9 binding domain-like
MFKNTLTAAAALALLLPGAVLAQTPSRPTPQAEARFTYDNNYLYATFQVDDAQLLGVHQEPMAKGIEDDDGVGLYLKVGNEPLRAMQVSVAGGFAFLENGIPKPLFTIKYGVTRQGTLNRLDDTDRGYTVELAIPWTALGVDGKAAATTKIAYAATVRKKGVAEAAIFPEGGTLDKPESFGMLTLQASATAPFIDGEQKIGEWPGVALRFPVPTAPIAGGTATVVPVSVDSSPLTAPPLPRDGVRERRLFARLSLAYQGDTTKITFPPQGVIGAAGTFVPTDQPANGFGPWYSADRVGWARTELTQLRRAGVEVALTQLGSPDVVTGPLEEKALTVLVAACREMQQERQATPLLGLWLDRSQVKGDLYLAVRRWFALVPPELRATVRVGGVSVYPVFLSDSSDLPPDAIEALRQKFAAEFGGLAQGVSLGIGLPFTTVTPGGQEPFVARRNGETYATSWESARKSGEPWVVLDSWNDFTRATELAPSRQYGDFYVELTRRLATVPDTTKPALLQFGALDLPRRLASGTLTALPIGLTNIGGKAITLDDSIQVGYRWFQDGKPIAEGPVRVPLRESILPGFGTTVTLGIATILADGKPLPAGSYELRLELLLPGERTGISVPVRVEEKLEDTVQIASTTLTPLLRAGGKFPATVHLRWLGKEALPPGEAQLLYQVLTADGKEVLSSGATPVGESLKPGTWADLPAVVELIGKDGVPLEPAYPERRLESADERKTGYRIRWALARTSSTTPVQGVYEERVALYPGEDDARIILAADATLPSSVEAEKTISVRVTLINRGLKRWNKGKVAVTGRWFQADGLRVNQGRAILNAFIDREVAPGEAIDVTAEIAVPERPGRYVLALFALRPPEVIFPMHPISRTGDMLQVPVTVTGGRQVPLDLTAQFDTDGVASEQRSRDGDLDGTGLTLPAEWFPSDHYGLNQGNLLYPSGYSADISSVAARSIVFRYGVTTDGVKNVIACNGQTLAVPKEKFFAIHMAATVTGGSERNLSVVLRYKDGTTETRTRVLRDIATPAGADDAVAFMTPRQRHAELDQAGVLTVRHIIFPVPVAKELVSVTLPSDPKVKLFAVTLER